MPSEPACSTADKPLLAVLRGERRDPPPMWMMRQAGRYLPEYRALRQDKGSFLDLVYDPDAAAEITLQPLNRFPQLDAAILFSDILIVPFAIGQNLTFIAGEGPRLTPPLAGASLDDLTPYPARIEPIYETVGRSVGSLLRKRRWSGSQAARGPLRLTWSQGRVAAISPKPAAWPMPTRAGFGDIIGRIEAVTLDYLSGQVDAGAEALQLFDSWAGSLSPAQFERWVIAPTARLVDALKRRHPDVPVIGFPKGAGGKLAAYARETGVDAIGLDETVDPVWAARELPEPCRCRAISTRWR